MIAKGTPHNNGAKLAAYMTTAKEGERAELWQVRGYASDDLVEAFRSVHVLAGATHCEQPFFHVQVRNPEGEELTRDQWERVADRIEAKIGYSDQPRAIGFHIDEASGHEHMHIAWSRLDEDTMTALPLPFYKLRLKEVCRDLEQEMGLTPVRNERPGPVMAPSRAEEDQARRLDVDLRDVRATIRECYEQADCGKAFAAALAERDLTLAKGDERDFVVIDAGGGLHALGKRVLGTTAARTRERLADLDALPTVEEVRQNLADRAPETTKPVVDLQREAFFASVAERRAETGAMQPANTALADAGHAVERVADTGVALAFGVGTALGGALRALDAPIDFVIDFFTGGSAETPPVPEAPPVREKTPDEEARATLRRTTPEMVAGNPDTRTVAEAHAVHLDDAQRAALRRQAEEIAARQRANWDDRER